jgi:uncharacterized protein
MKKEMKNLMIFLLLTFVWTWAFYTPLAISGNSPYEMPWMILLILGGMGPSVMGIVMAMVTFDKEGRRDFWKRCFSFLRIRWVWWCVIFLLFPILFWTAILIDVALGGVLPGMEQLRSLMSNPVMWPLAAFISFMSGPWAEEFGWRGYALDPMLKRWGVIPGTAALGVIWGIWHLPLFFMTATWHSQIGFGLSGLWTFVLRSASLALIMTWVYLKTDRSILSGLFIHFTSNFTGQLLAPLSERYDVLSMFIMLIVGLAVCVWLVREKRRVTYPTLLEG